MQIPHVRRVYSRQWLYHDYDKDPFYPHAGIHNIDTVFLNIWCRHSHVLYYFNIQGATELN